MQWIDFTVAIGKKINECLQYIIFIYFNMHLSVFKVLFLFMHYYVRVAEADRAFQEEHSVTSKIIVFRLLFYLFLLLNFTASNKKCSDFFYI